MFDFQEELYCLLLAANLLLCLAHRECARTAALEKATSRNRSFTWNVILCFIFRERTRTVAQATATSRRRTWAGSGATSALLTPLLQALERILTPFDL